MNTIKFHSTVGLITNSSSVVYTYQDSVKEAKQLVNTILKTFGITDKTADDLFYFDVLHSAEYYVDKLSDNYDDYYDDDDDDDEGESDGEDENIITDAEKEYDEDDVENLITSVLSGKTERPKWLKIYDGDYRADTWLYIVAKDKKYEKLAKDLREFLCSPGMEAGYN